MHKRFVKSKSDMTLLILSFLYVWYLYWCQVCLFFFL